MTYDGYVGSGQRITDNLTLRGSNFTGASGAANRTYTLPNAATTETPFVIIDNAALHELSQFTYSSKVLTIIQPMDNNAYVEVYYFKVA